MATLVSFHAHPDDESITTGGTLARAAAEGHRVVLVLATNGDHGEKPDDLADGESLVDRRRVETERSAAVLGVARVVWLGYADSGMTGWEQNGDAASFWQAPIDEAAHRLADVLRSERADVLTTYDWHGTYGHPDHIQVHRVGRRAAEIAATPAVFEATTNRDEIVRFVTEARASGVEPFEGMDFDPLGPADDGNPFGTPASEITHRVDVSAYIDVKRRSLMCHASQVSESSFFLQMPAERFAAAFGAEWFTKVGDPGPLRDGWIFE